MRFALYQPDIPQNAGGLLRLAACLGLAVEVIEPCGFLWDDRRLRRAGMDYRDLAAVTRHASWARFQAAGPAGRRVLLTTAGAVPHLSFAYRADDILLLGRESAGVPPEVHAAADARVVVPQTTGTRSLNVVTAAALVVGEALRQTAGWPPARPSVT
jgi:tRNA (cytidine/uridine-2'-O-)-methyltransferase